MVADPWGHLTGLGFIHKLTSPSLVPMSSKELSGSWKCEGRLYHTWKVGLQEYVGELWVGKGLPAFPPLTTFFHEWIWGPHLHPGAQRPEKLSKALSLMCLTAGDASYLLQMQAKNTEE